MAMTMIAESVEVRVYNVGFGDCILLTFHSRGGGRSRKKVSQRVLVDFGSTGRNSDGPNMLDVARQIVEDCRVDESTSKLDAIVVTHRHRDHMSGFGGKAGEHLVDNLAAPPKLILQPWTEDPAADDPLASFHDASQGAAKHIQSLRMAQTVTASILKEINVRQNMRMGRATDDEALFYGAKNLPFAGSHKGADSAVLSAGEVLNAEDLTNEDAIERLQGWKRGRAKPVYEYLSAGQTSMLGDGELIPRLNVDVLGPVGPAHWDQLMKHGETDELWERLNGLRDDQDSTGDDPAPDFVAFDEQQGPYGVRPIFAPEYQVCGGKSRKDNVRWLVDRLDALRGRQLLNFVRVLDSHLNNTSLVLLFEFGGFRMLFPGDAEVASWQLISNVTDNQGVRPNDDVILKLRATDLYKVGHHGSDNATPQLSLWRHLAEARGADHPLHCLLSTQSTRFKDKIPNLQLFETMQDSSDFQLMSTALPTSAAGPLNQPPGWDVLHKRGSRIVMGYARTFAVGSRD